MSRAILHTTLGQTSWIKSVLFGQHARTIQLHIAQDVYGCTAYISYVLLALFANSFITRRSLQEFLSLAKQCSHHEHLNPSACCMHQATAIYYLLSEKQKFTSIKNTT
jgi:hypothetical protein